MSSRILRVPKGIYCEREINDLAGKIVTNALAGKSFYDLAGFSIFINLAGERTYDLSRKCFQFMHY